MIAEAVATQNLTDADVDLDEQPLQDNEIISAARKCFIFRYRPVNAFYAVNKRLCK